MSYKSNLTVYDLSNIVKVAISEYGMEIQVNHAQWSFSGYSNQTSLKANDADVVIFEFEKSIPKNTIVRIVEVFKDKVLNNQNIEITLDNIYSAYTCNYIINIK